MTSNPEYGFLALADISGYEAYVTGTEFDHAQEIITMQNPRTRWMARPGYGSVASFLAIELKRLQRLLAHS